MSKSPKPAKKVKGKKVKPPMKAMKEKKLKPMKEKKVKPMKEKTKSGRTTGTNNDETKITKPVAIIWRKKTLREAV